jgi:hypothetical protein
MALNDNSEIIFEVDFELSENCYSVGSSSTGFKISELAGYFAN